jgi:hypothetical protein
LTVDVNKHAACRSSITSTIQHLFPQGVLATKALLLAVLGAAPLVFGDGGGGAAWNNADPKCTVLLAEASLVDGVALAV